MTFQPPTLHQTPLDQTSRCLTMQQFLLVNGHTGSTIKSLEPYLSFMFEKLKHKLCASSPWQLTCLVFAIWGFVDLIAKVEFTQIQSLPPSHRLIVAIVVLCAIYIIFRIVIYVTRNKSKLLHISDLNNGNALYLAFDDILNPTQIKYKERINIIIPANTTFETLVDNTVVSSETLHGKAVTQLCNSQNSNTIRKALKRSLSKRGISTIYDSETGANNVYPVGSIASINADDSKYFHFLALSTFHNNIAHTSVNDLFTAVNRLAEQLSEISQGFPVLIPILGTYLSRTQLNQNDVLRLLILTIMMHQDKMTSNIYIVTLEEKRKSLIYPL